MSLTAFVLSALTMIALAQESRSWRDPSTHRVQFVAVADGVRLEVLDWKGSGRPIVLLAGSGNTAHVFDGFAEKLTGSGRVYGITRRGYGASTHPVWGYDDQTLADDVLRVLNSLGIKKPVLVGHSMAGGELTTLGNQHSDRLAGLVYLDALGDPRDWPASDPAYMELFRKLPEAMRTPRPGDIPLPESERRNLSGYRSTQAIHDAIGAGQKKRDYSNIKVPVLAFFEFPRPTPPPGYQPKNDEEWTAIKAYTNATVPYVERWVKNLKGGVPEAKIVDLPEAGHFVFLTKEADVLRELRTFVASLP
jgi:pimeloyl-ACP methyl ester carboxylesterase